MNDPYETLQVPRDADAAQIKRAHRERSKKTHPDKGGSEAEFSAVAEAYALLRDPQSRTYYDEHGRAPEQTPRVSPAESLILEIFHARILARAMFDDPLREIQKELDQRHNHCVENLRAAEKAEREARQQLGRFRHTGEGDNLFEASFRQMLEKSIELGNQIRTQKDQIRAAQELLSSYEDTRPVEREEFFGERLRSHVGQPTEPFRPFKFKW